MHFLYIIYSEKNNTYYVGETESLTTRLKQHNQHYFKKSYTKFTNDWVFKVEFKCKTIEDARFLERFIKRMKSKVFIETIINDNSILKDILKKK